MNKKPFDYYEAPSQKMFDDVKRLSIEIWNTYDNTYGYVDEKVDRIKDITNVRDNCAFIVAMFDIHNQRRLLDMADGPTRDYLKQLLTYYYMPE